MSQLEESTEDYELDDRCIVPWKDGSIYAGKVRKILDPVRKVVIQGVPTRKGGSSAMIEDTTSFEKLKNDRGQRIPASVLNASSESQEKWFYVHYFGWKTNYDEWLPLQRMLPHTPRNINEMKRINNEIKEREKRKKEEELRAKKSLKRSLSPSINTTEGPRSARSSETGSPNTLLRPNKKQNTGDLPSRSASPSQSTSGSKPRRRVVLHDAPGQEIRLSVPLELKRLLVKDWQHITRDREIVRLPRPVCALEILRDFANATVPDKSSGEYENMTDFVKSMTTYFDYAFGMMLLYRFERNQYYAQRHNDANFKPSLVYGAEHLARLLVSMPSLLSQLSSMDDITMQWIVNQIEKLATFMTDHRIRYFAGEETYDSATRLYETYAVPHLAAEPVITQNTKEDNSPEEALASEEIEAERS